MLKQHKTYIFCLFSSLLTHVTSTANPRQLQPAPIPAQAAACSATNLDKLLLCHATNTFDHSKPPPDTSSQHAASLLPKQLQLGENPDNHPPEETTPPSTGDHIQLQPSPTAYAGRPLTFQAHATALHQNLHPLPVQQPGYTLDISC
jgi:hypothetical protein